MAFIPPEDRFFVTASLGGTITVRVSDTGEKVAKLESGHSLKVKALVFSRYGRYMVSVSDDMSAKVWDTRS